MVAGMSRSIRPETLLRSATLDLGSAPRLLGEDLCGVIVRAIKAVSKWRGSRGTSRSRRLTCSPSPKGAGVDGEDYERGEALLAARTDRRASRASHL